MFNWLSRQDADFVVNAFVEIPRRRNLIVVRSGGSTGNAQREPAHASVYLMWDTNEYRYTDLTGAEGREPQINIFNPRQRTGQESDDGIFRGWDVGMAPPGVGHTRLANALAEAVRLQGATEGVQYRKHSSAFTKSWSCASYAEKILRAAGLNVSAGFWVASPLELTTGRSRLKRFMLNKRNEMTGPAPRNQWYLRFKR